MKEDLCLKPIPFLRPRLVPLEAVMPHLESMYRSRIYSNFGPLNALFEQRIVQEWFKGGVATTVGNATLGLMLAISQAKRAGTKAIMPSFTFAATPLAAQWCGLEPVFVDVDPDEWVMAPAALAAALEKHGDDVAVVVPYATCGSAMDLAPYETLLARNIPVVVDAASSIGTTIDGHAFGHDFTGLIVYSMHATKAFPVGEGGLIHSADAGLVAKVRQAANFGFGAERAATTMGLNAKLTEITAAVALATLDDFAERRKRRCSLYSDYQSILSDVGLLQRGFRLQAVRGQVAPQWLAIRAPDHATQERAIQCAKDEGIELRRYFAPACHSHPQFKDCDNDGLVETRLLCETVLSLPLWEEMSLEDVSRIVMALHGAVA